MDVESDNDFWKGYTEAVEAMETRLNFVRLGINSDTKAFDVYLDVAKELKEVKNATPTED